MSAFDEERSNAFVRFRGMNATATGSRVERFVKPASRAARFVAERPPGLSRRERAAAPTLALFSAAMALALLRGILAMPLLISRRGSKARAA
jgi:hypothetical protein